MKKLLLLSILLLTLTLPVSASVGVSKKVTFQLYAPDLPDSSSVYITGSKSQLGNWDPGKVKMKRAGEHAWTITLSFSLQDEIEYKYTLGSWQREAVDAKGAPLSNFKVKIKEVKTVKDTVMYWSDKSARPVVGGVAGTVQYHSGLKAQGLQDRDIIVWLPPGYNEKADKKYPVLYMHDGQNVFDPATSSFGVDWQLDETSDSLIKAGAVEPFIIVGINNTSDRSEEYTPGVKGMAYMQFVVNTLKPLIDKTYRTKTDRENTAVGGSSAGGIISFMLAWEYPEVFSKAICMSPAFKIQHIDYVKVVEKDKGKKKDLFFYIDNGGIELEERLQPGIDDMLQALKQKGYEEKKDFVWVKAPQDEHSEGAWAKRAPVALKLIFPAKKSGR